jgi:hypothetical protein
MCQKVHLFHELYSEVALWWSWWSGAIKTGGEQCKTPLRLCHGRSLGADNTVALPLIETREVVWLVGETERETMEDSFRSVKCIHVGPACRPPVSLFFVHTFVRNEPARLARRRTAHLRLLIPQ